MTFTNSLGGFKGECEVLRGRQADAKRNVEVLERQNSKRIIEEATLRGSNMKNTLNKKHSRSRICRNETQQKQSSTSTNGIACFENNCRKRRRRRRRRRKKMMTRAQSSSRSRCEKRPQTCQRRSPREKKHEISSQLSVLAKRQRRKFSKRAEKIEISELGERSIVKRARSAKRVEEAEGLNRVPGVKGVSLNARLGKEKDARGQRK